jgi:hypothetical protein
MFDGNFFIGTLLTSKRVPNITGTGMVLGLITELQCFFFFAILWDAPTG